MTSTEGIREAFEKVQALTANLADQSLNRIRFNFKQWQFICNTARELYFSGPNQIGGKSTALLAFLVWTLRGIYPPGYVGVRFDRPVRIIAGSTKADKTREGITDRLFGPFGARGTGYLPRGSFHPKDDLVPLLGATKGSLARATVPHSSGGKSTISFISYEAGAYNLQMSTADVVALDEEPKYDVYDELRARTLHSRGLIRIVASPTLGHTKLRQEFKDGEGGRVYLPYTVDDCDHLTEEHKSEAKSMFPEGSEAALIRLYGDATPGDMRPFPFVKRDLECDPFDIPPTFHVNIGIDLNHGPTGTFAAVKMAYDPQTDKAYVVSVRKRQGATRSEQVDLLFALGGDRISVEWPHDGSRLMDDGRQISDFFKRRGIRMMHDHAHRVNSDGAKSNALSPMLDEAFERMKDGRLKVFSTSDNEVFYEEIRDYVLKDGKPKKNQEDHAIDAFIKALMGITWRSRPASESVMTQRHQDFKRSMANRHRDFFSGRRRRRGRPFAR